MSPAHTLRHKLLQAIANRRPPRLMLAQPRRVLVIRPDHLGDAILAAPAVAALRAAWPEAKLTGWVGPAGKQVWRHVPALDALEMCDFPGFGRRSKPSPLAPY